MSWKLNSLKYVSYKVKISIFCNKRPLCKGSTCLWQGPEKPWSHWYWEAEMEPTGFSWPADCSPGYFIPRVGLTWRLFCRHETEVALIIAPKFCKHETGKFILIYKNCCCCCCIIQTFEWWFSPHFRPLRIVKQNNLMQNSLILTQLVVLRRLSAILLKKYWIKKKCNERQSTHPGNGFYLQESKSWPFDRQCHKIQEMHRQ